MFELAVDAVVGGDMATLERLLRENPGLVQERSVRPHRATLLHYVAANGVEDERQKTPANILQITEILLKAGAAVDATADLYGGGATAFGLAATSFHPEKAGVQIRLLELLLSHGAAMDPGGRSTVVSCLHNGRKRASNFLAAHGALLDFEGAAGVGRMDLVQRLYAGATQDQREYGFLWACEYGRMPVVEFMLAQGFDVNTKRRETGLHWASYAGESEIVELLLSSKAAVDVRDDRFSSTPLGWARHGQNDSRVIDCLVAVGAS